MHLALRRSVLACFVLSGLALGGCDPASPILRRDSGPGVDSGSGEVDAGTEPRDAAPSIDAGDVCGDGVRGITEACDDSNRDPLDGCSDTCTIEDGFRCPDIAGACRAIVCGDSRVEAPERCDDGNHDALDGCSATCQVEDGWACAIPGVACQAAACGDGIVAGFEQCDDGMAVSPGCSAECRLEAGYLCATPGSACVPTVCGDGTAEGTEQCDDGNVRAYDGCDPSCHNEPSCAGGVCAAVCGDGVILPGGGEACDDGNLASGDGCSSTCAVEDGFTCTLAPLPLPDSIALPVVYRDMRGFTQVGSPTHPDFDTRGGSGITFGMVSDRLDGEKRPVFSGAVVGGSGALDTASFFDWYRDSARNIPLTDFLTLSRLAGTDSYGFATTAFFPIDGRGWNAPGSSAPESYAEPHNYSFTTEAHTWFEYHGDEVLAFSGDDDVWVFVDGRLCLDVGGLHPPESGVMDFSNPASAGDPQQIAVVTACRAGLTVGRVYELIVFHAERHCCGSNFQLTLSGFVSQASSCSPTCGDGVVTRFELCDDGPGMNTGAYGHCGMDCLSRGPFCGDMIVEPGSEACDAGIDDNDGRYGGCNPDCTAGPRCGDGVRQASEECDAGDLNGTDGSGCGATCRLLLI